MNTATSENDRQLPSIGPFLSARSSSEVSFLCSGAGWGNRRAAEAVAERIGPLPPGRIAPIEDMLPDAWKTADFDRYQKLCTRAPWSLRFIYTFPVNYMIKQKLADKKDIRSTGERIQAWMARSGARTLIACNHRAAFWAAAAKNIGVGHYDLWCAFTDYALSPGWKYLDWGQIQGSFGPIPHDSLPARLRVSHTEHPLIVARRFTVPTGADPEPHRILITGGGWGLGNLSAIARKLLDRSKNLIIDVYCGSNQQLYAKLQSLRRHYGERLHCSRGPSELFDGLKRSRAIVCRPGAMTLTEAAAAGKKIFLLPGLPVIEEANALYATTRFGAERFDPDRVIRWVK